MLIKEHFWCIFYSFVKTCKTTYKQDLLPYIWHFKRAFGKVSQKVIFFLLQRQLCGASSRAGHDARRLDGRVGADGRGRPLQRLGPEAEDPPRGRPALSTRVPHTREAHFWPIGEILLIHFRPWWHMSLIRYFLSPSLSCRKSDWARRGKTGWMNMYS